MEHIAALHPAPFAPSRLAPWWRGLLRRGRTAPDDRRAHAFGRGRFGDVRDPGAAPPTVSELYHAHRLKMVHLAVMLVDDRASAEDVVQDAFTALYRRHGEHIDEVDNALAYLRTAVVNASRSVLRRRRTARCYTPPHIPDAPSAEERVVLDEEHREVLAALGQLTVRRREVLVLRYWSDLTEAEIATTLGISRGSVKSIASRALDSLEKILEARA
ncbi:RNA polymerase sigma factor [Streptomyces violascens]|uniref:RNA polymerase sigma24 factor n=1 Tax=Streptomyces violascens TaxID=67381 RepID=A0ABQ3QGG1_9ACTN|nr:SigE family RNA polymerase sigma factor [Streptomyces violascens]GGT89472.1 RNA polymerase sigma24 factor [Streptomyces violascens]GHI36356.1 RNA polymerase sigma24 factor [Streptomyces violascens]